MKSTTDQTDSLVSGFLKCSEVAGKIVDAYGDGDNEILQVELLLGLKLGHGIGIGPGYWLEDRFHSDLGFEQNVGAALTYAFWMRGVR